jgi:hypothetical protein
MEVEPTLRAGFEGTREQGRAIEAPSRGLRSGGWGRARSAVGLSGLRTKGSGVEGRRTGCSPTRRREHERRPTIHSICSGEGGGVGRGYMPLPPLYHSTPRGQCALMPVSAEFQPQVLLAYGVGGDPRLPEHMHKLGVPQFQGHSYTLRMHISGLVLRQVHGRRR